MKQFREKIDLYIFLSIFFVRFSNGNEELHEGHLIIQISLKIFVVFLIRKLFGRLRCPFHIDVKK